MRRIHDLRCVECGKIAVDVLVEGSDYPSCRCGGARTWVPSRIQTDCWGSSHYITSLDREFGSKSELKSYLKSNGLSEAGDRKGGARNESHLRLGKTFSYRGQSSRTTAAENAGRRRAGN